MRLVASGARILSARTPSGINWMKQRQEGWLATGSFSAGDVHGHILYLVQPTGRGGLTLTGRVFLDS